VPITTTSPEQTTVRPEFFRLPKPGNSDPFFGLSRSFYYNGEARGWWRLVRIRDQGKERGVTLIPYQAVAAFVRTQAETGAQNKQK
jgi:hypothetical protein